MKQLPDFEMATSVSQVRTPAALEGAALATGIQDYEVRDLANLQTGSMVSHSRIVVTVQLTLAALHFNIPGDIVECGTYTGGTAAIMLRVLKLAAARCQEANSVCGRQRDFWGADSFQGLPAPVAMDREQESTKITVSSAHVAGSDTGDAGRYRSSRPAFEKTLQRFGVWKLLYARVHVLEGWFSETLPKATIGRIAFLRLDGDLYVSTMDPLKILYPRLQPGGFIYIDDYGGFLGCRNAVEQYRKQHNITTPMIPVPEKGNPSAFEAVWWQKSLVTADFPQAAVSILHVPLEGERGPQPADDGPPPAGGGARPADMLLSPPGSQQRRKRQSSGIRPRTETHGKSLLSR
eukprot:CAMPEP_0204588604 /NCGR_PEP_ID=MMETSP0661-20131031/48709_1 /ASSEMBLY_ACC=CAM_ASM_000606 /TAXON_ID=109239 /ORGANISM="Alexandrium margalefi, Strain AMGDE01CS-322" /LENGTH=348 /DNA_ID=CAMNT_0051598425 /DNA_START=223 /DNA_END=1266 /DNA_ORIENTATION=-